LNDAGALAESNVGIIIADDVHNFSPACDAILQSGNFSKLDRFLRFTHTSRRIVYYSFALSFLYNLVGLSFAVQGNLSPIIAAVLMPLSSVSVVAFATFSVALAARRL
jgi:Cu+-exporting ATPase